MPPPPPPSSPYGSVPPPPPQGGPGYYAVDHPKGTTILVLGILSLVVCSVLGPFAWAMGTTALREIDAAPGRYTNRGNVVAGRICGIISSVLLIAAAAIGLIALVAVVVTAPSS